MKVYIMTRTTRYTSTEECYTFADAFASKREAHRALTKEMVDLVSSEQELDTTEIGLPGVYEIVNAYHAGDEQETHDAILAIGDAQFYGDIFESEVNE